MLYCEKNGCICTFRPSFGAVVARAQLSPVGPEFQSPSVGLVWVFGKELVVSVVVPLWSDFKSMARSP